MLYIFVYVFSKIFYKNEFLKLHICNNTYVQQTLCSTLAKPGCNNEKIIKQIQNVAHSVLQLAWILKKKKKQWLGIRRLFYRSGGTCVHCSIKFWEKGIDISNQNCSFVYFPHSSSVFINIFWSCYYMCTCLGLSCIFYELTMLSLQNYLLHPC